VPLTLPGKETSIKRSTAQPAKTFNNLQTCIPVVSLAILRKIYRNKKKQKKKKILTGKSKGFCSLFLLLLLPHATYVKSFLFYFCTYTLKRAHARRDHNDIPIQCKASYNIKRSPQKDPPTPSSQVYLF
jgi:hypothetical protein